MFSKNENIVQYHKTISRRQDWQFNAIVCTYCKEEALLIIKKFFKDCGGIGFKYEEPSPKTEHKAPWVEISTKKTGTYRDFIKYTKGTDYD